MPPEIWATSCACTVEAKPKTDKRRKIFFTLLCKAENRESASPLKVTHSPLYVTIAGGYSSPSQMFQSAVSSLPNWIEVSSSLTAKLTAIMSWALANVISTAGVI